MVQKTYLKHSISIKKEKGEAKDVFVLLTSFVVFSTKFLKIEIIENNNHVMSLVA